MFTPGQVFAFMVAIVGLILTLLNIYDKLNSIKKRADEPLKAIEQRVAILEAKAIEHEARIKNNNEHIDAIDESIMVINRSTLALIDYQIQSCITDHKEVTEELKRAHDDLLEYLSKRKK